MQKKNLIFDHEQIELFRKRSNRFGRKQSDFLLSYAVEDLCYRLKDVNRIFKQALDLHSYDNLLAKHLLKNNIKSVTRVETAKLFLKDFPKSIVAEREDLSIIKDNSFELITTLLSMQYINNMPQYLRDIKSKLKADGLFIGAFLGAGSLNELREAFIEAEIKQKNGASPRIAPFIALKDFGDLLLATGFTMPVVDSEELIIEYKNLAELFDDLRSWGAQNALLNRAKRPMTRSFLKLVEEIYRANCNNIIKVTFNILWFSAWKYCDTQQAPARKASAKTSLKDVL